MLWKKWILAAWLLAGALFSGAALAQDEALDFGADEPEGVEVLTRGPVHEAFATPVTGEVKAHAVIAKEPPEAVDEVPPDLKPEGDDVAWIPGYWQWDEDRDDFLWVSGVWRKSPPDHRWVPGYWNKVNDGWQWVSGFWAPEAEKEVTYYDPPPATLEEGPTTDSPGDDYFWTPGVWMYSNTGYRWRPGFWARSQANWVWMPDRWNWTPSGAVYSAGYWDYDLAYRGSAFMPVYFQRSVYTQPGFVWRPQVALNAAGLLGNFWIRPNYGHYYFGNYYGGNYGGRGYMPIGQYWGRRGGWGWDPIVAYNQAYYGPRGINYANRLNQWHKFYVNNPNRRPPNTWREQVTIIRNQNVTINNINNVVNTNQFLKDDVSGKPAHVPNVMGLPINTLARASQQKARDDDDDRPRYAKVDKREQEFVAARAKESRQNNAQRAKAEARAQVAIDDKPDRDPKNAKVRTTFKLPTEVGRPGGDPPNSGDRPNPKRPDRDDEPDVKRPVPGDKPDVKRPGRDDKPDVVTPNELDRDRADPKPDRPRTKRPPARPDSKPDGDKPDRPDPKPDRPDPKPDRPDPKPDRPDPKPDRPDPKPDRPDPKPDRPDPKPDRPDPKPDRPDPKPDPKPRVDRPDPKPDPKPKVDRPDPKPDPKPKVDRPDPKPDPKPKADRPDPKPDPRPNPGGGGKKPGGKPGKGKDDK